MRTWGEIKSECVSLGFEKTSAYSKNVAAFVEAANRAQLLIASTARPVYESLVIRHAPQADAAPWTAYDFFELAGRDVFMDFASRPVLYGALEEETPPYEPFTRYRISGSRMWLPAENAGRYLVWYKKYPAKITAGTEDGTPLELDDSGALLMPLLMAHYIWLDDDERKAILYWNEYDDLKNQLAPTGARQISPPVLNNTTGWW